MGAVGGESDGQRSDFTSDGGGDRATTALIILLNPHSPTPKRFDSSLNANSIPTSTRQPVKKKG